MNDREALYSSSLYDAAASDNAAAEVYESIVLMDKLFSENEEYIKIINSHSIPLLEREALIDEAFSGNVHIYALNFIKLLAKRRSADIFASCVKHYEKLYFKAQNIERAKIVTAFELGDDKKKEIAEKIASSTGKEIIPEFSVDPSIMGGIVIETEGSSIDASVKTKLDSIKRFITK